MNRLPCLKSPIKKAQQGFTLVELITVIVLLGIVAIVVVPKFSGKSGFSEYAMQKRLINSLRNVQLKAMYDTRPNFCYRLIFNTESDSAQFGPSTANYLPGQETASCSTTLDNASDAYLKSDSGEIADENLSLVALDGANAISYIDFDNLGRPTNAANNCASGCIISLQGESTANICIEAEGYVYAC